MSKAIGFSQKPNNKIRPALAKWRWGVLAKAVEGLFRVSAKASCRVLHLQLKLEAIDSRQQLCRNPFANTFIQPG